LRRWHGMKLRLLVIGLLFLVLQTAGAAVWPGDELAVMCSRGCESKYPDSSSSFYIEPDVRAVILQGDDSGDWYENGIYTGTGQAIQVIIVTGGKEIKFVSDGRSRTVYLKTKSVSHCLPVIEKVYFTDDKNRRQIAVGQTRTVKAEIDRNGCDREDFAFSWETDSEVLEIEDPTVLKTDIYAKALPADGKSPSLKAVVRNKAGDRKEKTITVPVVSAATPELKLSVREKTGKNQNSIIISRAGSSTPNENAEIEHFYVTLYFGNEVVSERDYGKNVNITLGAKGDGLYEIVAYVKDSYDAASPLVRATIRIGVPEEGIPNLYPEKSAVYCNVGEPCELKVWYDNHGNGSYVIDWYDEKSGKKISDCQGTDCSIKFLNPGDYAAQARIRVIGESNYKKTDIAVTVR